MTGGIIYDTGTGISFDKTEPRDILECIGAVAPFDRDEPDDIVYHAHPPKGYGLTRAMQRAREDKP
jgi:hypothetical protein